MNLILGDCIEKMRGLPTDSIHAVITDPPYGLEFMGKEWDKFGGSVGRPTSTGFQEWCESWAKECLRVLKPGGFLLAMGGTRTHHRLTCGIEDAGFTIKDELEWAYNSGFPKAQDLSMLVEKKLGGKGEVTRVRTDGAGNTENSSYVQNKRQALEEHKGTGMGYLEKGGVYEEKKPTLTEAKEWQGWKTPALKPAHEPIILAQKPCEGSITENVLKHGVGGFNIDACRIPYQNQSEFEKLQENRMSERHIRAGEVAKGFGHTPEGLIGSEQSEKGRYPSNVLMEEPCFDNAEGVVTEKDAPEKGHNPKTTKNLKEYVYEGGWKGGEREESYFNDSGGFSKFFIIPKAAASEKHEDAFGDSIGQKHPTVKPVALMEHLIKLVTRQGQTVLDPFMGSGSTGVACKYQRREFIGIEKNEEYFKIAEKRLMIGKELGVY